MNGKKVLNINYEGKLYTIERKETEPQHTKVFDEDGIEYSRIASKLLREEVKRLNIDNSKDGYLYGKGAEVITHEYFRRVYSFKENQSNKFVSSVQELKRIGFKKVGKWSYQDNKIKLELKEMENEEGVLYSFVVDEEIKYIGKTIQKLVKRMKGYENPGKTQATNIRNNSSIQQILDLGNEVDIFCFKGEKTFYKDYEVNIAAGLEDNLIDKLKPEWNISGKN